MGFFFDGGFQIIFFLMFFLVFGIILVAFIKGIAQWGRNNRSPKLTVDAVVVAKRTQVSHSHHTMGDGAVHMSHSTCYYVTFQVESGDRMELYVDGSEFGMLVEGDRGKLSFQGTRYLGFSRGC